MNASLKYLLFGIALMLFGPAFPEILHLTFVYSVQYRLLSPLEGDLLSLIFPVAGLIMACIGFFKREAPAA